MRDFKNMQQTTAAPGKWMRVRVIFMGGIFVLLLAGVFSRAVVLQVNQTQKLKGMAEDQYVREIEVPARRGNIFDRRGIALAQSVDVDSVWVDPSMLPDVRAAAKALAKATGVAPAEVLEKLQKGNRFAWVKRQLSPAEVQKVKDLNLPGIGFAKEPRRFYPQRELAAHVIGIVGTDSHGLDGLELSFEDELTGDMAMRDMVRDAKGRKVMTDGLSGTQSKPGANVSLTLDRQLQYVTEKALQKAVDDAKATAGMAVVLDPKTGEILALANAPRFNPNSPSTASKESFRNRSVTDAFEPGSTFKAFVVAAALDSKTITEDTQFDCEKGSWVVGRHVIHDTHPHGILNAKGVLQVSSNICAAKIAQKLGRDKLAKAYRDFGFGEKANLGLPGEGRGVIPYPKAEVQLATESFGQGLTATAVQVASAYGALANGGVLMRPYLVSKVVDPDNVVLLENKPTVIRRVVSERAADSVVSMLESVVEKDGTAPRARIDEYRVAGKTGTAQKVDPQSRGYSDKRVASFIGMVPAENPRLVVFVVIDEPKTDVYGGLVAAPAFKEIAMQAMPYLAVPPSRVVPNSQPVVAVAVKAEQERSPVVQAIDRLDDEMNEVVDERSVRVPDVSGQSGRLAISHLLSASLEPHVSGSGRVLSQTPAAGSVVDKGTRITVELASRSH